MVFQVIRHLQIFRMEYLVASLLTLSRLDAGTLELEQENLDAASVIIEAR